MYKKNKNKTGISADVTVHTSKVFILQVDVLKKQFLPIHKHQMKNMLMFR